MAFKVGDLKNYGEYKKALKKEIKDMGGDVSTFYYFESFPFTDAPGTPMILVGSMAEDKIFKAAKNTDAKISGRGACVKVGNEYEFALNLGKLPFEKVKADMGNPNGLKLVKELSVKPAMTVPTDGAVEEKAKNRLVLLTQQFDSIKGRMQDGERKALRQHFGTIQEFMEDGKYLDALEEMDVTEKATAKVGNALRADSAKKTEQQGTGFIDADKVARESLNALKVVQTEIEEIEASILKSERAVSSMSSRKGVSAQKSVKENQEKIKAAKKLLEELKPTIAGLAKSAEGDKTVAKAMLKQYLETEARFNTVAREVLAPPGKIKDNPKLQKAKNKISGRVDEMGKASNWQSEEIKDSDKHGTGRHGAQTGIERQARRMASDVTPDQAHNPSGTAQYTAEWKTTIKWEEKNGKREIKDKAKVVRTVIDELNNTFGASKSSIFLNPAVEKEAVDKALKIASDQCVWTQWKKGGTWEDITSLTIVVPEPKSSLGYGMATERAAGFVKTSATNAANAVKEFEAGTITIDDLLKRLNVELKTDRTGDGAAMIRRARVVLTRSNVNSPWKNKTQFPTDDPAGWEVAKNTPLNGKQVRSATIAETTAPMYA